MTMPGLLFQVETLFATDEIVPHGDGLPAEKEIKPFHYCSAC